MPDQNATTGNLENAQNIVLAKSRYTAEHNAPCANLIEHFTLGKGNKQLTIPKAGQMSASDLQDGVDIIDSEDIGLTTTDLTTGEVGLRVVLTYKLVNQFNEDIFNLVGKQMGDAIARKRDTDIIALFSGLNGGTVLGADNKYLSLQNAAACVTFATANKFGSDVFVVHNPNALGYLSSSAKAIGATYYSGILQGWSEELLRNFWDIRINGVNFFHDGNIAAIAGYDSGYGVIASKGAMCIITGWEPRTENDKDISLRGYEIVTTTDYGVFELDDTLGAPMQYEMGALATNN